MKSEFGPHYGINLFPSVFHVINKAAKIKPSINEQNPHYH